MQGGANAISLINTINSIMGIDLDTLAPKPSVAGLGSHGGYCGPAIKPIALNMVAAVAADPAVGLESWAAERAAQCHADPLGARVLTMAAAQLPVATMADRLGFSARQTVS